MASTFSKPAAVLLGFAALVAAQGSACPAVPANSVCQVLRSRHTPSTLHCGGPQAHGTLTNPQVLQPACGVAQSSTCRDLCLSNSGCASFGYAQSTGACTLYSAPLGSMGYEKRSPGTGATFWSRKCFTYSSGASCYPPEPPTCSTTSFTAVGNSAGFGNGAYNEYFMSHGVTEDNWSNYGPSYGLVTFTYNGTMSACDALQSCVTSAWNVAQDGYTNNYDVDLHWLLDSGSWECNTYFENDVVPQSATFNVSNTNVGQVYGFYGN